MPLRCGLGHRTDFQPSRGSYSWGRSQLWYLIRVNGSSSELHSTHSSSQTPAIHSYHTPFSLLASHPNLFSLSSPSWYQSTSSAAYPLRDYWHTPNPVVLNFPHVRTIEEHLLQSFRPHPSSLHTAALSCILDFIHSPDTQ